MFSGHGLTNSPKHLPDIIFHLDNCSIINVGIRKALAWKSQPNFINLKKIYPTFKLAWIYNPLNDSMYNFSDQWSINQQEIKK